MQNSKYKKKILIHFNHNITEGQFNNFKDYL